MIGQMIMVGFAGSRGARPGVAAVRDQLAQGVLGGVVLYPENIGTPRQLRNLTAFLANANSEPVPLIAVDQEGGQVQRLTRRDGYIYFPSARTWREAELASPKARAALYEAWRRSSRMPASTSISDRWSISTSIRENPVIGRRKRSFGADPNAVTDLARAFIVAHREANVVTAAKHFPGHGSSRRDSHKVLADISTSWREKEIEPYACWRMRGCSTW